MRRHAIAQRGVKEAAAQAAALLEQELLRDHKAAEVGAVQRVGAVEAQQRLLPSLKRYLAAAQRHQRRGGGAQDRARRQVSAFQRWTQTIPQAAHGAVEANLLLKPVPVEVAHGELKIYAALGKTRACLSQRLLEYFG